MSQSEYNLKYDLLLLAASAIWGFAFVAQKEGMRHVGPFIFNGVRFALGSLVLLPLLSLKINPRPALCGKSLFLVGVAAGLFIFFGASLQQIGIIYTSAGKAGFITGLYVVIVPLLGHLLGQRTPPLTWAAAFIAASGLYLLSVKEGFYIEKGDLLVLAGAFFWAGHVLLLGKYASKSHAFRLAFLQFTTCSLLSLTAGLLFEKVSLTSLMQASAAILYAGLLSVGVAYTLQVLGQRGAHPSHAAILLSLETVFALIGGWLLLDERLSVKELAGCGLMLAAMFLSQLPLISGIKQRGK